MADSHLSGPGQPSGRAAVADYLATVSDQLPGPVAVRARITDELRDGFMEALGASLTRITLAGRAARRCLATRATLT